MTDIIHAMVLFILYMICPCVLYIPSNVKVHEYFQNAASARTELQTFANFARFEIIEKRAFRMRAAFLQGSIKSAILSQMILFLIFYMIRSVFRGWQFKIAPVFSDACSEKCLMVFLSRHDTDTS